MVLKINLRLAKLDRAVRRLVLETSFALEVKVGAEKSEALIPKSSDIRKKDRNWRRWIY